MNRRSFAKIFAFAGAAWFLPKTGFALNTKDISLYEIDGRTIFPMYCASGRVSSDICCFPLLRESANTILVFGYHSPISHRLSERSEYKVRIENDSKCLFAQAMQRGVSIIERKDGDNLPKHGEIVRFRS